MPIQYNSKKIIPAPFVSVEKNYDRTGDKTKIGSNFTLTLTGTLLPCKGSPNSDGEFWALGGYPDEAFQNDVEVLTTEKRQKFLQLKMQALRYLFAEDGHSFEVQPLDGSSPMKCYPRIQSINFEEGTWYDRVNYTIVLEADELYGSNTEHMKDAEDFFLDEDFFKDSSGVKLYLSDVSENWQLELVEGEPENLTNPYTFRLTHTLSAVGKKTYDDGGLVSAGWQQAKRWVETRLGIDNAFINGTLAFNLISMLPFNHVRQESTDELAGSYGVTETWILAKANSREDFTVSTVSSADTGLTTVRVEGEIIGLETRDSNYAITESKWTAALAKYESISVGSPNTIFTRAQTYSGVVLNTSALSSSVGKNPITGRISYTYEYDTRPSNCITGAISETIEVQDENPADIFASIPVMGRSYGPVLQDMATVSERSRTVSINVLMAPVSTCPTSAANVASMMNASPAAEVDAIIAAFRADLANNYSQVFKAQDSPSWNAKGGRYSRTVRWVFQNPL